MIYTGWGNWLHGRPAWQMIFNFQWKRGDSIKKERNCWSLARKELGSRPLCAWQPDGVKAGRVCRNKKAQDSATRAQVMLSVGRPINSGITQLGLVDCRPLWVYSKWSEGTIAGHLGLGRHQEADSACQRTWKKSLSSLGLARRTLLALFFATLP